MVSTLFYFIFFIKFISLEAKVRYGRPKVLTNSIVTNGFGISYLFINRNIKKKFPIKFDINQNFGDTCTEKEDTPYPHGRKHIPKKGKN